MDINIFIYIIIGLSIFILVTIAVITQSYKARRMNSLHEVLKSGQPARMKRMATKLLSKFPNNCNAHYLLAKAYMADNEKELALKEYMTIDEIGQFSEICQEIPFRDEILALFLYFGNHQEALKEILILARLNPDNVNYFYQAGSLFELLKKHSHAISYYKKAIKIDPKHIEALNAYGKIMYQTGNMEEARKALKTVIGLDDNNAQAHYYMGRLLRDVRDYINSLSELEIASKQPEYKIPALLEKGLTFFKMLHYDKAVKELENAVSMSTSDSDEQDILNARYLLALCFEQLREIDKAMEQWEIIDRLNPDFRDVSGKLRQYQAIRDDDLIKEFHIATSRKFEQICMKIVDAMEFSPVTYEAIDDGAQVTAYSRGGSWLRSRQQLHMFHILRTHKTVDRFALSTMHEAMRESEIRNGYFISSSPFTSAAISYAGSHSIEPMERDQLRTLLKNVSIQGKGKI